MNTNAIRSMARAVDSLDAAIKATGLGFVSDYLEAARAEVERAMHSEIGSIGASVAVPTKDTGDWQVDEATRIVRAGAFADVQF